MVRIALIVLLYTSVNSINAQQIEVIRFQDLEQLINQKKESYSVFNFWATWCQPCVAELPYFETLGDRYKDQITVYLISFDFVEDLDTKVKNFVAKRKLKSELKLLNETDYNSFIDKVSEEWSGAIPATLFVDNRTGKKRFYEGEFKENELEETLKEFMN